MNQNKVIVKISANSIYIFTQWNNKSLDIDINLNLIKKFKSDEERVWLKIYEGRINAKIPVINTSDTYSYFMKAEFGATSIYQLNTNDGAYIASVAVDNVSWTFGRFHIIINSLNQIYYTMNLVN